MGRAAGITEEELAGLAAFETVASFTPLEKAVLRFAVAMTDTPVDVPDSLFEELRRAFGPAELVELASAIAWENYRARFDHAFGIGSQGFTEGSFCPLPERRGN